MKSPLIRRIKERQSEGVETQEKSGSFHKFTSRYGDHQVGESFERNPIVSSSPSGHRRRHEEHEVTDRIHRESCVTSIIRRNLTFKDWLAAITYRLKRRFK